MFEVGILFLFKSIIINLIIPIIVGILFLWIFFGNKLNGIIFYIISFFIGTGVIAFSLFNLQFFYFGIGILEYLFLNFILIIILILKIFIKKQNFIHYIKTLKLTFNIKELKNSYKNLNLVNKIFFIVGSLFVFLFSLIGFLFTVNFPSYADDSFGNWHNPAINIYYDQGVKIFGNKDEILGKGRLGYPIYIPIYKALISDFNGIFNDIYINLWQFLGFIFFLIFIFFITFKKTTNLFYSIIPLVLICGLPLTFFHISEGYLDLTSAIYSVFTIYFIYQFLENNDLNDLSLGFLFGFILSHIKNDGLVVYFGGIIISLFIYLFYSKKIKSFLIGIFKNKDFLIKTSFFLIYFFLPFILLKSYLGLGYNQAAGEISGISFSFHPEIFSIFPHIFFNQDNFNVFLIFVFFILFFIIKNLKNKINLNNNFIFLSPLIIFLIFIAVFLFTENYLWVMNQTTVNRVFTMSFIILFSFIGILIFNSLNHVKK